MAQTDGNQRKSSMLTWFLVIVALIPFVLIIPGVDAEIDYRKLMRSPTLMGAADFLTDYPDSHRSVEVDTMAWKIVEKEGHFDTYLRQFPEGAYRVEAEERAKSAAFNALLESGDARAMVAHLTEHPDEPRKSDLLKAAIKALPSEAQPPPRVWDSHLSLSEVKIHVNDFRYRRVVLQEVADLYHLLGLKTVETQDPKQARVVAFGATGTNNSRYTMEVDTGLRSAPVSQAERRARNQAFATRFHQLEGQDVAVILLFLGNDGEKLWQVEVDASTPKHFSEDVNKTGNIIYDATASELEREFQRLWQRSGLQ